MKSVPVEDKGDVIDNGYMINYRDVNEEGQTRKTKPQEVLIIKAAVFFFNWEFNVYQHMYSNKTSVYTKHAIDTDRDGFNTGS